jgi:hypothetical protein
MATTTDFDVGDRVVMTATITDPADHTTVPQVDGEALVDPPSVTIDVTLPTGAIASYAATRISTGVYEAAHVAATPGRHAYKAIVPPPLESAETAAFYVRQPGA